jgi:hypothetical protein
MKGRLGRRRDLDLLGSLSIWNGFRKVYKEREV